ncbi:hypothetical protein GCM10027615_76430 [Plantactinospora veratri]
MRLFRSRTRTTVRPLLAIATTAAAVLACTTVPAGPASAADAPYDVLVFSKTAGFRHDSIAAGTQAIRELGAANNFTVTATEDAAAFSTANLGQYEVVVFLNTTGDTLNAAQQSAFESYIRSGKGYVGVHAAADTEYDWPFYGNLVGAYFASHPAIQQANVKAVDRGHAATAHLPQTWTRTDEWYNYRTNARSTARVLATLDESSYSGGGMGADHPHAWCKSYEGGRSFYTGGGHTQASYAEPAFRAHLLGGIRYAAGRSKADCRPESGYTTLYNGSTTGWSQAGPGSFTNADATLTSVGGMGLYWYSAKQFSSYSLKLDWRMAGDDNSGIFIGFPPSSDPWSAVDNGYEIQIDATDAADRTTGAVYTFKSADIAARDAALNPPGEWNSYELLVEGSGCGSTSTVCWSTTSPTPTRCGRWPGTSASRTTAPATTSRSGTSGSRNSVAAPDRTRARTPRSRPRRSARRAGSRWSARPAPTAVRRSGTWTRVTGRPTTGRT